MNKVFLLIFIIITFWSCDPEDNRLVVRNNSSDKIILSFVFDSELRSKKLNNIYRYYPLTFESNSKNKIGFLGNWNNEFIKAYSDSLINVCILKNIDSIISEKLDSILLNNIIEIKKYSIEEIKKKNWRITYPDDGFVKF